VDASGLDVDDDCDGFYDCADSVDCCSDASCATDPSCSGGGSSGSSPPDGCWNGDFNMTVTSTGAVNGTDTCTGNSDLAAGATYNSSTGVYDLAGSGSCSWGLGASSPFAQFGQDFELNQGSFIEDDGSGNYTMYADFTFIGAANGTTTTTMTSSSSVFLQEGPTAWTYLSFASGTYSMDMTLNWVAEGGSAAAAAACP